MYRATQRGDGTVASLGSKPAICFRGKKHALCLFVDWPIRVARRASADFDKYRPVPVPASMPAAATYPINLAVQHLEGYIPKYGITVGAQKLLTLAKRAARGEKLTVDDLEENAFEDEELLPSNYPLAFPPSGWKPDPEAAQQPVGETPAEQRRRNKRAGPVTTLVEGGQPVAEGAPAAATKRARVRGAESPMRRAVDFMKAEVEALGGLQEVTKDWRNQLFKRAAEQFGISPNTCGVQWGRTLVPEMGGKKVGGAPAAAGATPSRTTAAKADAPPAPTAEKPAAKPNTKPAAKPAEKPAQSAAPEERKRRAPVRGEASPMNQAVAYMQEEVQKFGGIEKAQADKAWRKQLYERAAAKFGISPNTCNVQWGRKIARK